MVQASKGVDRAKDIYQERSQRVRELKGEGRRIMGYICIYPPLEMMTALDLVPYRIFGDMREAITRADAYLPTVVCPFIRSYVDLGLKGRYEFLDGVVGCHVCDVGEKVPHIWQSFAHFPYYHFVDIPHRKHEPAQKFFRSQLNDFKKTLEAFAGGELSTEKLRGAIEVHNQQRALVRELYDLRKPDPPLISGTETFQVIKALMSLPVEEGNDLLRQIVDDVKQRRDGPQKKAARILVWGSIIDDVVMIEMIESAGANVVMDDTCVGSRAYWGDVKLTEDPLDGLATHYLVDIKCPRTFSEPPLVGMQKDYMADLQTRFSYLRDYVEEWAANGVILQSVKYCDTHGYEVPGLEDYLDSLGLPTTYLEHDYSEGSLAPLRTRTQAFLEVIG